MPRGAHHHRVKTSLQAALGLPGERMSEGRIVDLGMQGAGIEFDLGHGPRFPVGAEVRVRFQIEGRALVVAAQVRYRRDGDMRRYGLRFLRLDMLDRAMRASLHKLVNQRAAFRVEPSDAEQILVRLIVPGASDARSERWAAQLLDLSASGMAVKVPRRVEDALCDAEDLRVELTLPRQSRPLILMVVLRQRVLLSDGVRYGMFFDRDDPAFAGVENAVMAYVMRRQREALKKD